MKPVEQVMELDKNYNKGIFTKYIDTDEDIYNFIK